MTMSDKDDILIRSKLEALWADAPSFDGLFGDEVPGEARLRRVCQSTLMNYTAETPPFESLKLTEKVLPIRTKKHPSYVLWVTGLAVAACMGLLFLLPIPLNQPNETMGLALKKTTVRPNTKKRTTIRQQETPYLTQAIATPTLIKPLEVPAEPNMQSETASADTVDRNTTGEKLIKLLPSQLNGLDIGQAVKVEDAYAQAKLTKNRLKREKIQAGLNVNGGNRLLSFVNTNQGSDPLLSTSSESNKGLTVLEGAHGVSLRSSVASRNEWKAPDNIPPSSLANYEATYSLPINVGLSLSIPISSLMELQTGCYYTYMQSKTEGMAGISSFTLRRELHYIGIPVRLAFKIYQYRRLRVYMALGGAIEKGLTGTQNSTVVTQNGDITTWTGSQSVYGVQPATNGLAGISYEYPSGISFFLEPGASYCFKTDQPVSIRTEEPFSFNLGLGLRYRLK